MEIGVESGRIWGVAPVAVLVGVLYAIAIDYVQRHSYAEGYTWLEVVIGVGLTLVFVGMVYGPAVFLVTCCFFAFTGLPMIVTAARRYIIARRRVEEIRDDNKAERMA